MTYEENVHKVAELLAESYHGAHLWPSESESTRKRIIEKHKEAARIAVRLQAEAFKDGYITAIGHISDEFTLDYTSTQIKRGLIPAPEAKPVLVKEVTKCPYCGSSPLLYERGVCEDCGQPDYELE